MRTRLLLPAIGHVIGDVSIGAARLLGFSARTLGNRSRRNSTEAEVAYHEAVWAVYSRYLDGKRPARVCEIGPGDSLGMSVLFAGAGAQSVTFVDRFVIRPAPDDDNVCARLFERHSAKLAPRFNSLDDVDRVTELVHQKRAGVFFGESTGAFDLICSNAVLEHLDDPIAALTLMHATLAPGGSMVHVVDLRDHNLFEKQGPLTWLETPQWLHRQMRRNTAKPNRVLFSAYQHWASARPGVQFFVRHLVGDTRDFNGTPRNELPAEELARACDAVEASRHRFAPQFRDIPAEDLAISAFIMVLHKEEADSLF